MVSSNSPANRSEIMSRVRSRGNRSTELRLVKVFKAAGITGWRRNERIFGRPDFVFRKLRIVIFVDGCFWHGCRRHFRQPVDNFDYWDKKITGNRRRDRKVNAKLMRSGLRRLPSLPKQHALVFGNSVNLPTTFKVRDAAPTPWSGDAKIRELWYHEAGKQIELTLPAETAEKPQAPAIEAAAADGGGQDEDVPF